MRTPLVSVLVSPLALATLGALTACDREGPSAAAEAPAQAEAAPAAAPPPPAEAPLPEAAPAPEAAAPGRPPLPGDFRHGWELFVEHCADCHGEGRRGAPKSRTRSLAAPADLRDPILLAMRTNQQLAHAISQGGRFTGRSKWMPGFAQQLSEQDVMDLVALLRGDSISLQECFPQASHYVRVAEKDKGPPVLTAYQTGPLEGRTPEVVARAKIPAGAERVGFLMFAELELPKAGSTPVAFVADPSGTVIGLRVALPPPHNARAQQDLEATLIQRTPKLPKLVPLLDQGAKRLEAMARRARP